MLSALRELWSLHPDWRLGQLLVNAVGAGQPCPQIFYIEDEALQERLEKLILAAGQAS